MGPGTGPCNLGQRSLAPRPLAAALSLVRRQTGQAPNRGLSWLTRNVARIQAEAVVTASAPTFPAIAGNPALAPYPLLPIAAQAPSGASMAYGAPIDPKVMYSGG